MFVIIVNFDVKAEDLSDFLALMRVNASLSLEREVGCQVFDVLVSGADEARVVLYERYNNKESFDAHSRSDHYLSFDAASRAMVRAKEVIELTPVMMTDVTGAYASSQVSKCPEVG